MKKAKTRAAATELPGRRLTATATWIYLAFFVVLPLVALFVRAGGSAGRIVTIVTAPRTLSALRVSIECSLAGAAIASVCGLVIAWALARYRFPGHAILDAAVEVPLALPTSVAGITLTFLYSEHGWFGGALTKLGLHVAFTPLGITLALAFVGLPFAVRAVQPVVLALDPDLDEAARALGASRWQVLRRVHFPVIAPALVAGFSLSLARGLGEYGSVLFISGNLPFKTEIVPLLIVSKLEQFDYDGAAVLAAVLLAASALFVAGVQRLEHWVTRRFDPERRR